ncbi:MAG: hypothetical protein GY862_10760 [Gammaproteobacteria bacterium]|nr:hypothetical protein [Gammaproteobacteria bacterium]
MHKAQIHYQSVQACVAYLSYEFVLPSQLDEEKFAQLRSFISKLGENLYPAAIKVLHVKAQWFFVDFPSYGFPTFKINFFKDAPPPEVNTCLQLLNSQINSLLQEDA